MNINFDSIVSMLTQETKPETVASLLTQYGNLREAQGIEKGWQHCTDKFKRLDMVRKNRIKNHILEYDEENGCIKLIEFMRFFSAIIDELKVTAKYDSVNSEYAANLEALMWNKIGDLKTDRRILFNKD